ncbi:hypothetical protein CLV72_107352 [Allonocardiopsis opalescens]|uniref:Uncharacterized protein n=1 Tax=Allonocardiopsis opalescens TaxID=1144618 RepID=A0A2T0PZG6_9ACTN|nr:hypothetical protein CLV72_107352 [Allonocardiopsis opalescens]
MAQPHAHAPAFPHGRAAGCRRRSTAGGDPYERRPRRATTRAGPRGPPSPAQLKGRRSPRPQLRADRNRPPSPQPPDRGGPRASSPRAAATEAVPHVPHASPRPATTPATPTGDLARVWPATDANACQRTPTDATLTRRPRQSRRSQSPPIDQRTNPDRPGPRSPPARGWSLHGVVHRGGDLVLPARGDGPEVVSGPGERMVCSPRARGWSRGEPMRMSACVVLPARGDGPGDDIDTFTRRTCSPRARGWSHCREGRLMSRIVLPARAGMVPSPPPRCTPPSPQCSPRAGMVPRSHHPYGAGRGAPRARRDGT